MRNGTGDRPDSPSYSFKSIGSPGTRSILKAQSMCEMPSHTSRSAKAIPGHMRRLGRIENHEYCIGRRVVVTRRRTSNDHVPLRSLSEQIPTTSYCR